MYLNEFFKLFLEDQIDDSSIHSYEAINYPSSAISINGASTPKTVGHYLVFTYRVHGPKLRHFRRTFFHDLMTFYSKVNDFWDSEIGRFLPD